jgi:hypothetical protein
MTTKVAEKSDEVSAMLTAAAKGRALMGGTTAMRTAGTTYLPKFPAESVEAYDVRLKASWLFNGYRKTIRDMVGRVFDKSVEIIDAPEALEEWCANVDMQGRDLSTFARGVFEDSLSGPGVSYIMVDAPRREGTVTQAQALQQNLRPYLVHLTAGELLGWRTALVDNVTTLVQARVLEVVREDDPKDEFGQVTLPQVRVLDLIDGRVNVRIYRKAEKAKEWAVVEEFATEQTAIMIVPVYTNRTGFFTGEPLLDDLADINVAHWQSQSDQRNVLHAARVPILFANRVQADSIVIGSNTAVIADAEGAELKWVEHTGKAIDAGRQDLKDLEFQMETFGLQLLAARAQSATGEALDAKKETSVLAMTADALQDALEQALLWMCEIGGIDYDPDVRVNKEFGVSMMTAQDVGALLQSYRDGVLSRETVITEFTRRGFVRSDLTADEEAERLDEEDIGSPIDAGMALGGAEQPGGMPNQAGR